MKQLTREDKVELLEMARDGHYDPAKHQRVAEFFSLIFGTNPDDYERLSGVELMLVIALGRKLQGDTLKEDFTAILNAATEAAAKVLKERNMSCDLNIP